nr:retrovirus-related Pol polyprotein from transposon TNT 1-94 [Tanacetum cinerariifolium]
CENRLYVLKDEHRAFVATTTNSKKASYELWHTRLGHVSFDVISTLNKLGILSITSLLPKPVICTSCQLAKSQRLSFNNNMSRSSYPLDLIHCHCNINGFPQRHSGGFPGDLSLGIRFPGDLSPGKRRWERLVRDSFPGDNPRRKGSSSDTNILKLELTTFLQDTPPTLNSSSDSPNCAKSHESSSNGNHSCTLCLPITDLASESSPAYPSSTQESSSSHDTFPAHDSPMLPLSTISTPAQ